MEPETRLELSRDGRSWRCGDRGARPDAGVYLLIGSPVGHSRSPDIQNAALRDAGRPERYYTLDLEAGRLPILKAGAADLDLRGFNVTHPLKAAVAGLCDDLTPAAQAAGVVNTVKVADGAWRGHNTDIEGIATALRAIVETATGGTPPTRAWILGAGGSARAAVLAIKALGIGTCSVHARPGASRASFEAWIGSGADVPTDLRLHDWPTAGTRPLPDDALVVSAVPTGVVTRPSFTARGGGVFLDLRYGGSAGGDPGPRWIWRDGSSVLLAQGAASFRWWFDRDPSFPAMQKALSSRTG